MLIDIHAHFYTERAGRGDWQERNRSRLQAGESMGIDWHVASILGSWGAESPTYFPSPDDITHGNDAMVRLVDDHPERLRGYCVVNPNYPEHALQELSRRFDQGMVGVKLAASRRADDRLVDPIAAVAAEHGAPLLHHVWQHRRREWPGQEASDAVELARLAERNPETRFILAHIGGGGDWAHSLRCLRTVPNVFVDLSGSGVDGGMLEAVLDAVGVGRILWGCDVTMDTGLAKLRYLRSLGLPEREWDGIAGANAVSIFPEGTFSS